MRLSRFIIMTVALAACVPRPRPPSADEVQRPFPDFGGRTVMVLPVQSATPLVAPPVNADTTRRAITLTPEQLVSLDAEITFWLAEGGRVKWVTAAAVDKAVQGAPMLNVRLRELPVRDFMRSKLEAIGDPLYGDLRAIGMLTDARIALLPIGALWIPEAGGSGRIHLAVALIDTMGGRVIWQGVVAGAAASRVDAAAIASTAQALAGQTR